MSKITVTPVKVTPAKATVQLPAYLIGPVWTYLNGSPKTYDLTGSYEDLCALRDLLDEAMKELSNLS